MHSWLMLTDCSPDTLCSDSSYEYKYKQQLWNNLKEKYNWVFTDSLKFLPPPFWQKKTGNKNLANI